MTRLSVLLLAVLIVSCGSVGTPTPVVTASPAPTASPTPSPSPSPVVSAKGLITLKSPAVNAKLTSPVTITGDASVFEAALAWRITDTGGRVLAEGFTTASLGAPGRGTYSITATYTVTTETVAFIEVFSRSAKDGNIDEIVRIPVTLR
jgi:hypothetical protein